MCALSLMELAFRKPKKQRRLNFGEIAQHCRVGASEVERLFAQLADCGSIFCHDQKGRSSRSSRSSSSCILVVVTVVVEFILESYHRLNNIDFVSI